MPSRPPQSRGPDPVWKRRLHEPSWLLLPLRLFLGITFAYAGLQKLANPDYLDANAPTSVARQMQSLQHTTPLGPLLGLSLHAPTLVGLLIAVGELAVGIGTLLGLLTRIAAIGGALLALTFFLTVSWATTPYYYGADIVFVFAWSVFVAFGSGGLSLDAWLRRRARRDVGLGPRPARVSVPAPQLKALCSRGAKCGLGNDGVCSRTAGCPVFPPEERLPARTREQLARRTVVVSALTAGGAAALTVLTAGLAATIGRAVGGTSRPKRRQTDLGVANLSPAATTTAPTVGSSGTTPASGSSGTAGGPVIATTASIAVGDAKSFTNPADGNPAYVVHPSGGTFVAFSAICTHAGCPVQYDKPDGAFVCPCHGGAYDARTGRVLQGPPPAPLPQIPITIIAGQIQLR